MCGIAGTVRFAGQATAIDSQDVKQMLAAQANRGPDGEGLHVSGPVVLGHRRLSIIDLREIASQPMPNETRDIWVTFNGEIYNHRELRAELEQAGHSFRTSADTEVLVHGYEQWDFEGLYSRLRGMFAFAIYDERGLGRSSDPFFFAARDRLGIKPFYYTITGSRFSFASETRALVRGGAAAEPDRKALAAFLSLGSVPSPRTWLKDIECLSPGHAIEISGDKLRTRKLWDISYQRSGASGIGTVLEDSIERHLIADVPAGVFLSSGVDSAAIACLAAKRGATPVRTLTITFDERDFSEARAAGDLARKFGTEHQAVCVTSADFEQALPKFLHSVDQPAADGVNTWFVSRAAREAGLKVVLSGLGGDELFHGYPHYGWLVTGNGIPGTYMRSSASTRHMLNCGGSLYGWLTGKDKWKRFGYCRDRNVDDALYLLIRGFFPPDDVGRLLGIGLDAVKDALDQTFANSNCAEKTTAVSNRFHYLEMKRYLHDQLLRDADVFSMAHSVELRVPLLYDPLVEAACAIAPREKVARGINKPVLVDATGSAEIRRRAMLPKRGFTFPFASWLKGNAAMFEERALAGNLLESSAVRDCWKRFRAGRLHWSRAWSTVVLASLSSRN